jgi:hypothetical protein
MPFFKAMSNLKWLFGDNTLTQEQQNTAKINFIRGHYKNLAALDKDLTERHRDILSGNVYCGHGTTKWTPILATVALGIIGIVQVVVVNVDKENSTAWTTGTGITEAGIGIAVTVSLFIANWVNSYSADSVSGLKDLRIFAAANEKTIWEAGKNYDAHSLGCCPSCMC